MRASLTLRQLAAATLVMIAFSVPGWAAAPFKAPAPYMYLAMLSQVPFSADAHTTVTGGQAPYAEREYIQVSHQKMRRELLGVHDPRHMSVYISDFERRDDYGAYGLNPALKVYWAIERPTVDGKPPTETEIDSVMSRFRWRDSEWERRGSERVDGEQAIRYRYIGQSNDTSDTQLNAWFTASDGVLCKVSVTDANGTATTRLSNIEIGSPPGSAFDVGDDYARVSLQAYMSWLIMHPDSELHGSLEGEAAVDAIRAVGEGQ